MERYQQALSSCLRNDGDLSITGADIISSDSFRLYIPRKGMSASPFFIVMADGSRGDTASLKVTVKDKSGAEWTEEYSFIIQ